MSDDDLMMIWGLVMLTACVGAMVWLVVVQG